MKPLRVLVLMDKQLVPPQNTSGIDTQKAAWKTEFDVVTTLRKIGHEVEPLGVETELGIIRNAIDAFKPHIAFNMLEAFHNVAIFEPNVVSYLELLKIPYTGCNPRGLLLAKDKGLSKKLMAYHRIPMPDFAVFRKGQKLRVPKDLTFPLIVKSLTEESSVGISQASVVEDEQKLRERIAFIHESIGTDALVEQFIDGRELYVGVMGNQRLRAFPVWEMQFTKMPDDVHRIATGRVKWNPKYQEKYGIQTAELKDAPEGANERIRHLSKRVYRSLELSGYARIDLRLDKDGRIYVLEANPNPQIAQDEDFAESAKQSGMPYTNLLQHIITLGLQWRPESNR
ncbi:MAG: ATP-grasp domain-containing protein [Nitrospira sp.]|nr:ATP-grasp domain-containing protein [Nitrospira sp.]